MDYTKLIYWITVAENARGFFITMVVIFTLIIIIATVANLIYAAEGDEHEREITRQWMWRAYPFCLIFWLLTIFTPDRRESILIIAAGNTLNYLSSDEQGKEIPKKLEELVLTELEAYAIESKVDLNIKKKKEDLISSVKDMTTKELIEQLKINPDLRDLLLND